MILNTEEVQNASQEVAYKVPPQACRGDLQSLTQEFASSGV